MFYKIAIRLDASHVKNRYEILENIMIEEIYDHAVKLRLDENLANVWYDKFTQWGITRERINWPTLIEDVITLSKKHPQYTFFVEAIEDDDRMPFYPMDDWELEIFVAKKGELVAA